MRSRSQILAATIATALLSAQLARAEGSTTHFNLPAQSLAESLRAIAGQTSSNILFDRSLVDGLSAKPLNAYLTVEQALKSLLEGTGLTYRSTDEKTVMILAVDTRTTSLAREDERAESDRRLRLARNEDAGSASEVPGGWHLAQLEQASSSQDGQISSADEEVVVTGLYVKSVTIGKTEQSLREIPQSVSVLTREQMDAQNLITVDDGLKRVTGVSVVSNDSKSTNFYARGYLLETQHDGVPTAGAALNGISQLDLAVYDRIEVLRGPSGCCKGPGIPEAWSTWSRSAL